MSRFEGYQAHAPQLTAYLTTYPEGRPSGTTDSLLWAIKDFGYRPTLSVDHIVVREEPETNGVIALIASKTIYANHYLAGRIQMGALIDGDVALGTPGRFIVLVDRVDFDDSLSGLKRKLLGSGLQSDIEARMQLLRALADGGR